MMKMWTAIIALALLGSTLADDASLVNRQQEEYFRYEGVIMTSIMTPRQSHSGTNLTMDITLTRRGQEAYFSFQNVKARTFNSEFFFTGELPPITSQRAVEALQANFTVYLGRDRSSQQEVMKVPQGEKLWVTNIRKAIVAMFRVPPYTRDYQSSRQMTQQQQDPILRPSYSKQQTTFLGRCNCSYTITYDYANGSYPNTYPGYSFPVQGKPTPSETPRFLRMRSSVDFDSCRDDIRYTKASFGNFSQSYKNSFKDVQERSVVGQYVLVQVKSQDQTMYYIKGANVVGTQFVRPFGQDTGRIAVITNQTLYATSRPFPRQPQPQQLQGVSTWMYQFASPASPPQGSQVEWVKYQSKSDRMYPVYPEYAILGEHPKPQNELQSFAQQILNEVPQLQQQSVDYNRHQYNGTTDGRLVERLKQLSQVIRALEKSKIQALYNSVPNGQQPEQKIKRQSFLDAASASGSAAAIEVLLQAFKNKQVDEYRQAGLITTLINNINDPASVQQLQDYVMTIQPSTSLYLGSMSYLNLAKLLQRVCTDRQIKKYAVPHHILGSKTCPLDGASKFVEHLKGKIQSSSTQEYEKMLCVQALGRVGDPSTISFISRIVNDKFSSSQKYDTKVKLAAIYSLSKNFHQKYQKQEILAYLLPVVQAPTEPFELRHAALMTIIELRPNATIFQRLALQTWHEPSHKMKSLLTSVFTTFAESTDQKQWKSINTARKYLFMMNAVNPRYNQSGFFPVRDTIPGYGIGIERTFSWLDEYRSPSTPRQMYQRYRGIYGGIKVPLYELYSIVQGDQLRGRQFASSSRDAQHRRDQERFSHLSESMNIEMMRVMEKQVYFIVGAFNYEVFLPVDNVTIPHIMSWVSSNMNLGQGRSKHPFFDMEHAVKYFNPVDIVNVLPTPFGLPSIIEVQTPNNWYWGNEFTVTNPESQLSMVNMTVDGNNKMTLKAQTYATVPLPWSQEASVAAYDTEATISVPGKYSMAMNSTFPYIISRVKLEPRFRGERPVVYIRSKPFTALRPMPPASDITTVTSLRTSLANVSHSYNESIWMRQDWVGLKAHIEYQGDADSPFKQQTIMEAVSQPSRLLTLLTTPTKHDFTLALKLNMEQSQTKIISLAALFDYSLLWNSQQFYTRSRSSLSAQQVAQKISASISPEVLAGLSQSGEVDKVVALVAANYTQPNVLTRQYQAVFSVGDTTTTSDNQYKRQYVTNVMKATHPKKEEEKKTCLIIEAKEKKSVEVPSQWFAYTEASLLAGSQCSASEKVLEAKTNYYLATRDIVQQRSEAPQSLRSSPVLVPRERRYDPAMDTAWKEDSYFDRITTEINFQENAPNYVSNITYIARDWLAGYVFPHLVVNHMPEHPAPQSKTYVDMKRNNYTGTFDTVISTQEYTAVVEQLPIGPFVDWVTPLLGNRIPLMHSSSSRPYMQAMTSFGSGDTCVITPTNVTTFNRVFFGMTPTTCEKVAAYVHHESESFYLAVNLKNTNNDKIKLEYPSIGTFEVLAENMVVKVNGQPITQSVYSIKNHRGSKVGEIKRSPYGVSIRIYGKLSLYYGTANRSIPAVLLTLSNQFKGLPKGICGNFNGDTPRDMRTPEGCILTPETGKPYAASWIAQRNQCRDSAVQDDLRQYQNILQNSCQKNISLNKRN